MDLLKLLLVWAGVAPVAAPTSARGVCGEDSLANILRHLPRGEADQVWVGAQHDGHPCHARTHARVVAALAELTALDAHIKRREVGRVSVGAAVAAAVEVVATGDETPRPGHVGDVDVEIAQDLCVREREERCGEGGGEGRERKGGGGTGVREGGAGCAVLCVKLIWGREWRA